LAQVRTITGDTAGAIRQLDLVLDALPTLSRFAVFESGQSAALGRAFALRANLAGAIGDSTQRQFWARQALIIWRHADPSLTPAVERLRSLAGTVP
jgi:hypothetical protein